jgi:hypothetical protein
VTLTALIQKAFVIPRITPITWFEYSFTYAAGLLNAMTATAPKLKTIATSSILRIPSLRKQYDKAVEMNGEVLTRIMYKPMGSILSANTRAVKPTKPAMFRKSIWQYMFLGTVMGIFCFTI